MRDQPPGTAVIKLMDTRIKQCAYILNEFKKVRNKITDKKIADKGIKEAENVLDRMRKERDETKILCKAIKMNMAEMEKRLKDTYKNGKTHR